MTRAAVHLALATVLSTVPATTLAYSSPGLYAADPARSGGGGGRVFTGSPDDGLDCGVCHRGGPAPRQTLIGGPGEVYTPGATYQFELRWPEGTHVGLAAEASDAEGRAIGQLRLPAGHDLVTEERCAGGGPGGQAIALEGRQAIASGDCGASLLRFQWTAPEDPAEGALYVTIVHGDGDGTARGDGARALVVPLTTRVDELGCAVDRATTGWAWLWLLLLRRRRLALLLTLTAGCARVQPHERGRLAQPDMQLAPDPDLSAGPEHALDYREGSAGGLGGGGGGCGCN